MILVFENRLGTVGKKRPGKVTHIRSSSTVTSMHQRREIVKQSKPHSKFLHEEFRLGNSLFSRSQASALGTQLFEALLRLRDANASHTA